MDEKKTRKKRYTISCSDMPDALLQKTNALNYFRQFGRIVKITFRLKSKSCIVDYDSDDSVFDAVDNGGFYEGNYFTIRPFTRKVKKSAEEVDPNWPQDPELQAELDALSEIVPHQHVFRSPEPPDEPKKEKIVKSDIKIRKPIVSKAPIKQSSAKMEVKRKPIDPVELDRLVGIIRQIAHTTEDKYNILDARDKLIRLHSVRQTDIGKAKKVVGTCPDMCPEKERYLRESKHQVSLYEQVNDNLGEYKINHKTAIKQYSRSSADQEMPLAHELRPVSVLKYTMNYLLRDIINLCDAPDVNVADWYHFVWDRTRGIRKDITQQQLCCRGSVELVEQCARFHIHCAARLIAEDVSVFDPKINTENLTKCLQTLKYMYHDLALQNIYCPNEAEFRGYIILLNLHDGNFMWEVKQLRREIQKSPEINFAIKLFLALDNNNFVSFFKLVRQTNYLNACLLLRYFNEVRYSTINRMIRTHSPRALLTQIPLDELERLLAFENRDALVTFIDLHGLSLNETGTHVILDRQSFTTANLTYELDRAIKIVESKREISVGEIIGGCKLDCLEEFRNHLPHNSFDERGYLKKTEIQDQWISQNRGEKIAEVPLVKSESIFTKKAAETKVSNTIFEKPTETKVASIFDKPAEIKSSNIFNKPEMKSSSIFEKPVDMKPTSSIFDKTSETSTSTNIFNKNFEAKSTTNIFDKAESKTTTTSIFHKPGTEVKKIGSIFDGGAASSNFMFKKPPEVSSSSSFTVKSSDIFSKTTQAPPFMINQPLEMKPTQLFSIANKTYQEQNQLYTPQDTTDKIAGSIPPPAIESISSTFIFNQPLKTTPSLLGASKDTVDRAAVEPSTLTPNIFANQLLKSSNIFDKTQTSITLPNTFQAPNKITTSEINPQSFKSNFNSNISGFMTKIPSIAVQEDNTSKSVLFMPQNQIVPSVNELEKEKQRQEKLEKERQLEVLKKAEEQRLKELEAKAEVELREKLLEQVKRKQKEREEIAESVLNELICAIEIKETQMRLKQIGNNMKLWKIRNMGRKWLSKVYNRRKKRKAVDDSPIWVAKRSYVEEAGELSIPNQDLTLVNMKQYKLKNHQVPITQKSVVPIDFKNTIFCCLKDTLQRLENTIINTFYWKIIFSIPDEKECEFHSNKFLTALENAFLLQKKDEFLLLDSVKPNNSDLLNICIRHVIGNIPSTDEKYDAIILGINDTEMLQKMKYRLDKFTKSIHKRNLVIILRQGPNPKSKEEIIQILCLEHLMENHLIRNLSIFIDSHYSNQEFVDYIEKSLLFSANNVQKLPPLHMDLLTNFLHINIGNEFAQRLKDSAKENIALQLSFTDHKTVISLYNQAISLLIDIATDENKYKYANFPEELKDYLPYNFSCPCTFEYFPNYWKDQEFRHNIVKSLALLNFPQLESRWPPEDMSAFEDILQSYCKKIVDAKQLDVIFLKVLSFALDYIEQGSDFEAQIESFPWIDLLQIFISYKINVILKMESDYDKIIIYNKNDLKDYNSTAWWLHSEIIHDKIEELSELLHDRNAQSVMDCEERSLCEDTHIEEIDFDLDEKLVEVYNHEDKDEQIKKQKHDLSEFKALLEDLDSSMKIQKLAMQKFCGIVEKELSKQ